MKKLTTILSLSILSLFLISCGSETKTEQSKADTQQTVEPKKAEPQKLESKQVETQKIEIIKTDPKIVEIKKAESQDKSSDSEISFSVYDTKGTLRNSSEWIGKKPVVINFWGTWCPPCRAEIPALVKAYEEYKNKGVEILGLAVGRDTPQKVNAFAAQNNVNWVMMMGSKETSQMFQIRSVPSTIFIDKNGKIMKVWSPRSNSLVETYVGGLHYDQFTGYLDSLLTL